MFLKFLLMIQVIYVYYTSSGNELILFIGQKILISDDVSDKGKTRQVGLRSQKRMELFIIFAINYSFGKDT